MVQAGLSERDPVMRFNRQDRDFLRDSRASAKKINNYTNFATRLRMEKLRGSWPLRQQKANDRFKLQMQIRDRTEQSALRDQILHIESHKSYMNIPPHMQQSLSELQSQLRG